MYTYPITRNAQNRPTITTEQLAAEREAALQRIRAKQRKQRIAAQQRSLDIDEALMALHAADVTFPRFASVAARWEHYSDR